MSDQVNSKPKISLPPAAIKEAFKAADQAAKLAKGSPVFNKVNVFDAEVLPVDGEISSKPNISHVSPQTHPDSSPTLLATRTFPPSLPNDPVYTSVDNVYVPSNLPAEEIDTKPKDKRENSPKSEDIANKINSLIPDIQNFFSLLKMDANNESARRGVVKEFLVKENIIPDKKTFKLTNLLVVNGRKTQEVMEVCDYIQKSLLEGTKIYILPVKLGEDIEFAYGISPRASTVDVEEVDNLQPANDTRPFSEKEKTQLKKLKEEENTQEVVNSHDEAYEQATLEIEKILEQARDGQNDSLAFDEAVTDRQEKDKQISERLQRRDEKMYYIYTQKFETSTNKSQTAQEIFREADRLHQKGYISSAMYQKIFHEIRGRLGKQVEDISTKAAEIVKAAKERKEEDKKKTVDIDDILLDYPRKFKLRDARHNAVDKKDIELFRTEFNKFIHYYSHEGYKFIRYKGHSYNLSSKTDLEVFEYALYSL
jgi:hypothetical protein